MNGLGFYTPSSTMAKPKHGDLTQDGIPWTGGGRSRRSGVHVPASPNCCRFPPGLNSKKIYSACVKPLATKYHGEQGRYKFSLHDFGTQVYRHIIDTGMDTPFMFKNKEGKYVNIVKEPNAVTFKEVRTVAEQRMRTDDLYEKENVLWSARFLMGCLSQSQVDQLKKYQFAEDNGPMLWMALQAINQPVSQSFIKSLQNRLKTMRLDKQRREHVPTFTSKILAMCERLEKLNALPPDIKSMLSMSLMYCSNSSFLDHF